MSRFNESVKAVVVIAMLLAFIYTSYFLEFRISIPGTSSTYLFPEVKANADPWYGRVVTPGEMDATKWITQNTGKTDKFIADIFGAELIMGMTARVSTIGGDWANAPNPVKLMGDTNTVYITENTELAYQLVKEHNVSYIFVPHRATFSGYGWELGNHTKFLDTRYFEMAYSNDDVTIYRVLP